MHANTQMLRGEMAELRGEMTELRADFRVDMAALQVSTQRLFAGAIAANVVGVVTALVA